MTEQEPNIEIRITQPDILKALASIDKLVDLRTHRELFNPLLNNAANLELDERFNPTTIKSLRSEDE